MQSNLMTVYISYLVNYNKSKTLPQNFIKHYKNI